MSNDTSQFPPQEAGAEPRDEQPEAGAPEPAAAVEPVEAEAPRRGRPLLTLAIILIAAAVLIGLAHRYASRQVPISAGPAGEGLGQPAPDFMVKDIRGNTFKLSELKGKVVILDFWATWCQPCKSLLKRLQEIKERDKDVEVIAISIDDASAQAMAVNYIQGKRFTFITLFDAEGQVARMLNPSLQVPFTLIVDRGGRIVYSHAGYVPGIEAELLARIRACR